MAQTTKTNPNLVGLIDQLRLVARTNDAPVWRTVADRLSGPGRHWAELNLHHLDRHAPDGATVVVPGKVLATGALTKKLTVGAYAYSGKAKERIEKAGGKALTLAQLSADHPKGSKLLLLG